MPDDKTTVNRPIEPLQVTIIGTGDASRLTTGMTATTEGAHMPNFVTVIVPPIVAVGVRAAYLFMFTLTGFLTIKMTPASSNAVLTAIQAADFYHLVLAGASVSASAALFGLIKDVTTILSGLSAKFPLATGSV